MINTSKILSHWSRKVSKVRKQLVIYECTTADTSSLVITLLSSAASSSNKLWIACKTSSLSINMIWGNSLTECDRSWSRSTRSTARIPAAQSLVTSANNSSSNRMSPRAQSKPHACGQWLTHSTWSRVCKSNRWFLHREWPFHRNKLCPSSRSKRRRTVNFSNSDPG